MVRLRYDRDQIEQENYLELVRNTDFIEQAYVWENFFVVQFSKKYLEKFGDIMKNVPVWNKAFSVSMIKPELKEFLFL